MVADKAVADRNMFGERNLRSQLTTVRRRICLAVLIAAGRRSAGADGVPDLYSLRRREAELLVRLDMVGANVEEA